MNNIRGLDYVAIAYTYGINDKKIAKDLYTQAMNITRRLAGNLPQDKLESEFGDELMGNYQDLLSLEKKGKYKESVKLNKVKEAMSTKDAVKLMGEIVKIEIPFAEGITGRYATGKVFRNVAEAQKFFNSIPMDDAPGYDKVDVKITFSDGSQLKSYRYDRNPKTVFTTDLLGYLERYVTMNESKNKENTMKNKTKIKEYLDGSLELDQLITDIDLEEEETYSSAMINPNTVLSTDIEEEDDLSYMNDDLYIDDYSDEYEEGCNYKKREYATDGRPNTNGDLDDDELSGYGTTYGDFDVPNEYGTTDDKEIIAKADPYAIDSEINMGTEY